MRPIIFVLIFAFSLHLEAEVQEWVYELIGDVALFATVRKVLTDKSAIFQFLEHSAKTLVIVKACGIKQLFTR